MASTAGPSTRTRDHEHRGSRRSLLDRAEHGETVHLPHAEVRHSGQHRLLEGADAASPPSASVTS
jgi:hypothetical protein